MLIACAVLAASPLELDAQSRRRPTPSYVGGHEPDQQEGARILEDMRSIGLAGSYYQEFELRRLPRKGAESRLSGRWFGDRNATGPVTRIELATSPTETIVVLVQNGPNPEVWRLAADRAPHVVTGGEVMEPLAETVLSAADLQIPFMYWKDFTFEGRVPFRGRPAYVFLLYPPAAQADRYPGVAGARVFIDTQFRAPLQAQWVDEEGTPLKTITVLDLKKVDETWIVKSFEVRDDRTRDKTRLVVTAVALNAKLPGGLFLPTGPGGRAEVTFAPGELKPVR